MSFQEAIAAGDIVNYELWLPETTTAEGFPVELKEFREGDEDGVVFIEGSGLVQLMAFGMNKSLLLLETAFQGAFHLGCM